MPFKCNSVCPSPPTPAQPSRWERCRHLAVLGKGRILFINFSLIEVPRAMQIAFSSLSASLSWIAPRTAGLLWAGSFSPGGQNEAISEEGAGLGRVWDQCFSGQWLCGETRSCLLAQASVSPVLCAHVISLSAWRQAGSPLCLGLGVLAEGLEVRGLSRG